MEWLQLMGFCLLAAAMVMVLRQLSAPIAGLLSAAFGVLLVGLLLPGIRAYIETILRFLDTLSLDSAYYRIMIKAMGIVLVTQMAVQVCRDMDAPAIARRAEFCGRMALLSVSVPVFVELTRLAVGVLR